ncbi:MAG TPA: WD40 repeat domain-containing protein [Anaerolineales bacterium]
MKKILYTLLSAGTLLVANLFASNGTFQVGVETPTPPSTPILIPPPGIESTPVDGPTPIPTFVPTEEPGDPYGELYFSVIVPDFASQPDPDIPIDKFITRLVRLPGSCVVGLIECPAPENVPTPFDTQVMLPTSYSGGVRLLTWSPDGRYGVIIVKPPDDFTRGLTDEEYEQFRAGKLEDLNISPSTLYLFDSQTDTWREFYSADRKFLSNVNWSPDGQWIAFYATSGGLVIHPPQADDGVYIIHPDGSGLQRVGDGGHLLGWVGDSLLLKHDINPTSWLNPGLEDFSHVVEKLSLDGQVTTLFKSSRLVNYALSPDGGSLLTADSTTRTGGSPQRAVDVLALDGSVIHSFGTFSNTSSSVYPFAWSPDGTQVAFANLRRLYVAPRTTQLDVSADTFGVHPETREVYVADDTFMTPHYTDLQFSRDNKYLLMLVYEGFTHFVVVSLETGQAAPLTIPHLDPFVVDDNYLGDPMFFSWRQ